MRGRIFGVPRSGLLNFSLLAVVISGVAAQYVPQIAAIGISVAALGVVVAIAALASQILERSNSEFSIRHTLPEEIDHVAPVDIASAAGQAPNLSADDILWIEGITLRNSRGIVLSQDFSEKTLDRDLALAKKLAMRRTSSICRLAYGVDSEQRSKPGSYWWSQPWNPGAVVILPSSIGTESSPSMHSGQRISSAH